MQAARTYPARKLLHGIRFHFLSIIFPEWVCTPQPAIRNRQRIINAAAFESLPWRTALAQNCISADAQFSIPNACGLGSASGGYLFRTRKRLRVLGKSESPGKIPPNRRKWHLWHEKREIGKIAGRRVKKARPGIYGIMPELHSSNHHTSELKLWLRSHGEIRHE